MDSNQYAKRLLVFFENTDSNYIGIYFSLFIHLILLLFIVGIPNFFKPKPIMLPNIIPIEIVNVSDVTSIVEKKVDKKNEPVEKKVLKQKNFNSSENFEIKKIETKEKIEITKKEITDVELKKEIVIKEKKSPKIKIEEKLEPLKLNENVESLSTKKIKPKIKPKPVQNITKKTDSDLKTIPKPEPKPEPEFSIASMLKDLRNEKSNNLAEEKSEDQLDEISNLEDNNENENVTLSISEIDLLRQQLSSCWNAPAGAVIEKGMKVTIASKVHKNRRVLESSVRIIDTNISKSNAFYGPITESAMRTLLNPECTPLKLPEDKFDLWKNLTITFDYSIMKGYSD